MKKDVARQASSSLRLAGLRLAGRLELLRLTGRLELLLLISMMLCASFAVTAAQRGGNVLFGDVSIDESQVSGPKPEILHLILYATTGNVVARQPITNRSRYKFLDVPNGIYDLAVEVENQEVMRTRITVREIRPTDVRHDIYLEWRAPAHKRPGGAGTVAVIEEYARSEANGAKFTRALEESRKKNYEAAAALLGEMVRDDPKDFVAWTELGTVQFKKAQLTEAAQAYQRALVERPNFALALLNLGRLRLAQKEYERALEVLQRAVRAQPSSAEANHLLGECYLQLKLGSQAVGYLNEAIRLDPAGKAEVHLRLATLYNAAGLKDRAALEYEKFLEKKPDHPDRQKLRKYIAEHKKGVGSRE